MRPAPVSEVAGPQGAAAHGRLRGCQGPSPGGAGAARRRRRRRHRCLIPPKGCARGRRRRRERRRKQEEAEHERHMLVLDRRVSANEQLTPAASYAWRALAGHLPQPGQGEEEEEEEEGAAQIFFSILLGPRSLQLEIWNLFYELLVSGCPSSYVLVLPEEFLRILGCLVLQWTGSYVSLVPCGKFPVVLHEGGPRIR